MKESKLQKNYDPDRFIEYLSAKPNLNCYGRAIYCVK